MTDAHVEVMNNVCNLVVDNFYDFVKDKGYPADNKVLPRYSISVIPITDHYRSLNDNRYRFKDRPLFCGKDARHCRPGDSPWFLYGWTDKQNEYHFIRSDLQISESKDANAFRVIFAHELFHQLSWESGSFMTHGNAQIEEALAHSFTRYIGLGDI